MNRSRWASENITGGAELQRPLQGAGGPLHGFPCEAAPGGGAGNAVEVADPDGGAARQDWQERTSVVRPHYLSSHSGV